MKPPFLFRKDSGGRSQQGTWEGSRGVAFIYGKETNQRELLFKLETERRSDSVDRLARVDRSQLAAEPGARWQIEKS